MGIPEAIKSGAGGELAIAQESQSISGPNYAAIAGRTTAHITILKSAVEGVVPSLGQLVDFFHWVGRGSERNVFTSEKGTKGIAENDIRKLRDNGFLTMADGHRFIAEPADAVCFALSMCNLAAVVAERGASLDTIFGYAPESRIALLQAIQATETGSPIPILAIENKTRELQGRKYNPVSTRELIKRLGDLKKVGIIDLVKMRTQVRGLLGWHVVRAMQVDDVLNALNFRRGNLTVQDLEKWSQRLLGLSEKAAAARFGSITDLDKALLDLAKGFLDPPKLRELLGASRKEEMPIEESQGKALQLLMHGDRTISQIAEHLPQHPDVVHRKVLQSMESHQVRLIQKKPRTKRLQQITYEATSGAREEFVSMRSRVQALFSNKYLSTTTQELRTRLRVTSYIRKVLLEAALIDLQEQGIIRKEGDILKAELINQSLTAWEDIIRRIRDGSGGWAVVSYTWRPNIPQYAKNDYKNARVLSGDIKEIRGDLSASVGELSEGELHDLATLPTVMQEKQEAMGMTRPHLFTDLENRGFLRMHLIINLSGMRFGRSSLIQPIHSHVRFNLLDQLDFAINMALLQQRVSENARAIRDRVLAEK